MFSQCLRGFANFDPVPGFPRLPRGEGSRFPVEQLIAMNLPDQFSLLGSAG